MQSDEVTVTDIEMLKKALTNIGVSAPAGVEELSAQYQSYARQVVQKVAEGYPFVIPRDHPGERLYEAYRDLSGEMGG